MGRTMRAGELECLHGIGHSAGVHGCDGCCTQLVHKAKAEAWDKGYEAGLTDFASSMTTNPYRQGETE